MVSRRLGLRIGRLAVHTRAMPGKPAFDRAARLAAAVALALALAACAGVADALCPPGNCPNIPYGRINSDH